MFKPNQIEPNLTGSLSSECEMQNKKEFARQALAKIVFVLQSTLSKTYAIFGLIQTNPCSDLKKC